MEYNTYRPHEALDQNTPIEYVESTLKVLPMYSARTEDKEIARVVYTELFDNLREAERVRVSTNWLERWETFRNIDWLTYLEYPEFTTKEVRRLLHNQQITSAVFLAVVQCQDA